MIYVHMIYMIYHVNIIQLWFIYKVKSNFSKHVLMIIHLSQTLIGAIQN